MRKLAIFDFDGTLFTKDTLPYIGKSWKKQTGHNLRYYLLYAKIAPVLLLYKLKLIPRETLKYLAVKNFHSIFQGMRKKEIALLFTTVFQQIHPYFNGKVIEELVSAKKEGYHTVLLSGCYTGLLEVIAEQLGFDTILGMELSFQDDLFDHRAPLHFINGERKQELLRNCFHKTEIDWQKSRSYADSITDLPILTPVGQPTAVNPEPRLLKIALHKHWRILNG